MVGTGLLERVGAGAANAQRISSLVAFLTKSWSFTIHRLQDATDTNRHASNQLCVTKRIFAQVINGDSFNWLLDSQHSICEIHPTAGQCVHREKPVNEDNHIKQYITAKGKEKQKQTVFLSSHGCDLLLAFPTQNSELEL